MFSLYFDIVILVFSHFGFEGRTLVMIALVPCQCLSITFMCALSSRVTSITAALGAHIFIQQVVSWWRGS